MLLTPCPAHERPPELQSFRQAFKKTPEIIRSYELFCDRSPQKITKLLLSDTFFLLNVLQKTNCRMVP